MYPIVLYLSALKSNCNSTDFIYTTSLFISEIFHSTLGNLPKTFSSTVVFPGTKYFLLSFIPASAHLHHKINYSNAEISELLKDFNTSSFGKKIILQIRFVLANRRKKENDSRKPGKKIILWGYIYWRSCLGKENC